MLVGFLLVCATVLAKDSGKDGCEKASNTDCGEELKRAGCATCTAVGPNGQTCLTCNGGQKVQLNGISCGDSCPSNSAANPDICECNEGFNLNSGKDGCEKASNTDCGEELKRAGCATCTAVGPNGQTCLTCNGGQKVQLNGISCGDSCPSNSAANPDICECNEGFNLNSGKDGCEKASNTDCGEELKRAGCATCTAVGPNGQTCLTCNGGQKVQLNGISCGDSCPSNSAANPDICECNEGFNLNSGKDGCEKASNTDCGEELKRAGCATCTAVGPNGQTCLTCNGGQKVQLNGISCGDSCPSNSAANPDICECNEGFNLNSGKDGCEKASNTQCNTPNCKICDNPKTDNEVCTECNDGDYLTPTNQCVPDCTTISGYYGDNDKKCKACSPECAECVGPANNQCSSCPAGKKLTYTDDSNPNNGGTCGDACKVSADGTGCETCGAQIGGTAYCSKCKTSTQAPLNGDCAASSRATFCTKMGNGVCTQCEDNYFLKDGGCYQTDRQPGKQVCSNAQGGNGKCQTCANGLAATDGNCAECHPTCATCSAPSTASSCKTCATGYYKENGDDTTDGPCMKCSEKISGCKQCVSSSGSSVICLESEVGTGGSTNKSGLSTGAIAGISVAVIVVVGGLVGFLCWWFLCRGKA
uniref:Cysteine-rich protein n=1 Tax=Giardia intestinalis TaxID=5741 RepID=O97448_GIAIN|nr:cysteine-rich protein [Giardia intestinalis]